MLHSDTGADNLDEGRLQTSVIAMHPLSEENYIYVAMWAVNGVSMYMCYIILPLFTYVWNNR